MQDKAICHLNIEFTYKGKLAGGNDEYNPVIHAWSSTFSNDRAFTDCEIEWENKENQLSKRHTIGVVLKDVHALSQDDSIWLEVVADGVNEDRVPVGVRAGMTQILLRDVAKAHQKNQHFEEKLDLVLPTYQTKHGPYKKGELHVKINKQENQDVLSQFKFKPLSKYDFVEENHEFIGTVLDYTTNSVLFPFEEGSKKIGGPFEPASKNLEGFSAPLWQNNVDLPISHYFQQYSEMTHDENTMKNFAKISLDRAGITAEDFCKVVSEQMKERGSKYNIRFTEMVTATVSTACLLSTSMPYKSDETFRIKGNNGKAKRVPLESFNDGLRLGGDDCEGLAEINHRVARIIELGDPSKADPKIAWKKDGSWDDPVLQSMQQIMHIMVPLGTLGEVTSSRLGNSQGTDKNKPLIIDSDEDVNNVEFGFHMWWEHMPLYDFEKRINKNIRDPKKHLRLYPEEGPLPEWHSKIPHLVGEGTGWLFPLLRPLSEYYDDNTSKGKQTNGKSITDKISTRQQQLTIEKAESLHRAKLSSFEIATKNGIALQIAVVEKQPELTEYHPDARLSGFYRRSTNSYTDKLKRNGINLTEFVWLENKPRVPESTSHSFAKGEEFLENKWRWGSNLRDKLYKKEDISLLPIPELHEHEERLYRSLSKHLSPAVSPLLTPQEETKMRNAVEPRLAELQKQLDGANKNKTMPQDHPVIKQHFVYRMEMFFSAKLKDGTTLPQQLVRDIENNKNIVGAKVVFEPLTDSFQNVRLTVDVTTPEMHKLTMDHRFSKDKIPLVDFLHSDFIDLPPLSSRKYKKDIALKNKKTNEILQLTFKKKSLLDAFILGLNDKPLDEFKTSSELKAHNKGIHFMQQGFQLNTLKKS